MEAKGKLHYPALYQGKENTPLIEKKNERVPENFLNYGYQNIKRRLKFH
jgi:hypothetical protein